MTHDLDIAELERRLFPRPVDAWLPDEWAAFFVQAQSLVDEYGKDHILAMVDDLVLAGAAATPAAADAIRHSIRP
ncbi:hypothetical protein BH09ACT7_BH09ACT7_33420 [soil metagenome]